METPKQREGGCHWDDGVSVPDRGNTKARHWVNDIFDPFFSMLSYDEHLFNFEKQTQKFTT